MRSPKLALALRYLGTYCRLMKESLWVYDSTVGGGVIRTEWMTKDILPAKAERIGYSKEKPKVVQ